MKYIINENQLKYILEVVTKNDVICDNCGWSWKLSEGGDDPYTCHKCGHINK
jgi:ribosomal protein S27AE